MKRKEPDPSLDDDRPSVSTPKRLKTATNGTADASITDNGSTAVTPSKRVRIAENGLPPSGLKTPTQKDKAKSLFATPTRDTKLSTPSRIKNADRSAKRKSARLLLEQDEDDVWDGADRLAEEILADEEESDDGAPVDEDQDVRESVEADVAAPAAEDAAGTETQTPKRRRGRPKGAKNKRSPTPEGELPPHERYFFQNRAGPPQTSNNNLSKVSLLTHEEYFEKLRQYVDPHKEEKELLLQLHRRAFPQWYFELCEQFNICLYGYGSKRRLVHEFADWLYQRSPSSSPPTIVIVNGYTPSISVRSIFATIVSAILGPDTPSKLGAQPTEVLEFLQSVLKSRRPAAPVTVLINSIDAPPLRRATNQALLARLAATPGISVLATADTPNFTLLWDVSLRDQFNFVFHDCTTFAHYEAEMTNVVDEVHNLIGRRGRRVGGKEGVGFVLKSLPENARNLYRLLLTELLSGMDQGHGSDDEDAEDNHARRDHEETGVEFRTLYHKAAEEFIASSEMMFRTLLKEFHDHQMITTRTDASGMEVLGVPLSREEMEGVLEELVLS